MPGSLRRRRWWILLPVLYLGLLVVSHAVEPPYQREPGRELETSRVKAVRGDALGPQEVTLAWRRWDPPSAGAAPPADATEGIPPSAGERVSAAAERVPPTAERVPPTAERILSATERILSATERIPVILLHGSPGSHDDFDRLAPLLAAEGRSLLAPDLPGFGASTRRVPDYSIRAHARYVLQLLDALAIDRAHLLGYSMGGGVALELYRLAPERVASVTLLSSIGVQEMELLGDYSLNRLLHGLQLGALWVLHRAVPHFGALTHFPLDLPYARNFYDTDQRPLRAVLGALEPPVLILHGKDDLLVPREAAIEHHRLVPQSELVMLDASHFFVFSGEPDAGPLLADFWERVERGEASARAGASPERVRLAAAPYDRRSSPRWMGPALLAIGALLALATLVSEDLTSIGAGLLVADGRLPFAVASAACCAGIFIGDLLLFGAGRLFGRPALRRAPLRWWLSEDAVARGSAWFERRGAAVVLLSRFTPGTRLATYFAAGLLRTSFWRFAIYMAVAVALWTPLLVLFAQLAGETALDRVGSLRANLALLLLAAIVILIVMRKLLLPLLSWRGRRELVGAWRRWTRWEFWPPWLFYPPVLAYALGLGVRHRGLTVFTATNPAFPAGGFVGEPKADILTLLDAACERLAAGGEVSPVALVPHWRRIDPGPLPDRLGALRAFRDGAAVEFPLVLKPDVGQRGQGVEVVVDEAAAARWLERRPEPCIAQRYVAGLEFGLFYYRQPAAERGHLFSITEKRPPVLVGDGRSTLEELVLADPRAVALARVYRAELGARGAEVPAAGERVKLVDIGTHARGSIFLDGERHRTAALEAAIDQLSRSIDGFCFGRYDVRVESVEDLERGRGLAVLELNGVTAESTDIYDPANGVVRAWRKLMMQWRLAFEIGAAQRARGAPVTTVRELARLLWRHRALLPR